MNWTTILPKGLKTNNLTLDECRNFKEYYALLDKKISGPIGYQIFYKLNFHLLFFGVSCLEENRFPSFNKCWESLSSIYLTPEFDNEWFPQLWMLCDFPVEKGSTKTILDYFYDFMKENNSSMNLTDQDNFEQFYQELSNSRIGFYQEIKSTTKTTKFKELFTGNIVETVRSVPYYEPGEIFVTRIVSFLGDNFQIQDPQNFPRGAKQAISQMISNKFFYLSDTRDDKEDYEKFMELAGPYLLSITDNRVDSPIFDPNEYLTYYNK